jgi:hypothetical protein
VKGFEQWEGQHYPRRVVILLQAVPDTGFPGLLDSEYEAKGLKLIVGNPSSNREWKENYVFVCGDNWEGLQCEKDDNFIFVRREWGVPPSSGVCVCFFAWLEFRHFVFFF